MPYWKYRPYATVDLPDRQWPNAVVTRAPVWCSTDLRDGNQALVKPMGLERKQAMFDLLVRLGVKEIEVGFPAASKTDYDFVRQLVAEDRIPADTTIAVLTQARPELIEETVRALAGARRAIVHLYNSTSTTQRRVVFGLDKAGTVRLANRATALVKRLAEEHDGEIVFQYSPESFHHTELEFALEICEAVRATWGGPMIVNLPTTVEAFPPNVYADRVEWFLRHVAARDELVISVHPHNDRGTAVATAELGLMAGADRVEGTLFGNGERTGNVDLITVAFNLLTQGVDPKLDLSWIDEAKRIVEHCNELPVHPRHPWVGELVYTAFSGSHQDAIKKGMHAQERSKSSVWDVPYLPIDPADLGRTYEAIIRVNSQSGKAGVSYLLESEYGLELPRGLQIDFARHVQAITDRGGDELAADELLAEFHAHYLDHASPYELGAYTHSSGAEDSIVAGVRVDGVEHEVTGAGNGPIAALVDAFAGTFGVAIDVRDYHEHALSATADATAAAYIEADVDGALTWGVGLHTSIATASLRALVNAVNRALTERKLLAELTLTFDQPELTRPLGSGADRAEERRPHPGDLELLDRTRGRATG
jgi:2-isopropylmalate synthase